MAGGRGSRLKMGEKPLVKLFGRPLIDYVALALEDSSVDRIFVSATENVPQTREWAIKRGLDVVETDARITVTTIRWQTRDRMIMLWRLPSLPP